MWGRIRNREGHEKVKEKEQKVVDAIKIVDVSGIFG
jgi:hypothetical protein